jgi:hypothetical protein
MSVGKNKFYVYEHWRSDTDECFYVGKGRRGRAYYMNLRHKHHLAVQEELRLSGSRVLVTIVAREMSEQDAYLLEQQRILHWRSVGHPLVNLTNGGGGCSGFRRSEEWKIGVSRLMKGKIVSAETRHKISVSQIGRTIPAETRAKTSASVKRSWTPERRAEQSARMKQRLLSDPILASGAFFLYGAKTGEVGAVSG